MRVLALGPYVGDLEREIITFRPYAKWLSKVIPHDVLYLSTHYNRTFLYDDFVESGNVIPIDSKYSEDDTTQSGFIQKGMTQKEYNSVIKKFKNRVLLLGHKKKDLENIHLKYRKTIVQYPVYNKIFNKVLVSDSEDNGKGKFLFIPYGLEEEVLKKVYDYIKEDVMVIGDSSCLLENENVLSHEERNDIHYIFSLLSRCKGIITPLNYWTSIANLQNLSVFSWGNEVSMYREDGLYNFGNKRCCIMPEMEMVTLINSIRSFMGRI